MTIVLDICVDDFVDIVLLNPWMFRLTM